MSVQAGMYRHFKGDVYEVIGVGVHTETGESLVCYHPEGAPEELKFRPVEVFLAVVDHAGCELARFERVRE